MTTAESQVVRPPAQLEEEVEYCNVSSFRAFLLSAVDVLRQHPARRYVVTKHGQPEAVLMSFRTYSIMKRVMDRALAHAATRNSSEAIDAAFARLLDDKHKEGPTLQHTEESAHSEGREGKR
jgi:PHD/YefM family antitoxin component YafN of YafNO toxin-antitoxin module